MVERRQGGEKDDSERTGDLKWLYVIDDVITFFCSEYVNYM